MTSTVLDVTVLLLCISAGVVTLAGTPGTVADTWRSGADASSVADRLTTETATVSYGHGSDADDRSAAGSRSIHATLGELLATATWSRNATDDAFRVRVLDVAEERFGPRVRIDVGPATASPDAAEGTEQPRARSPLSVGSPPPHDATVATALVTLPAPSTAPARVERVRFVVRTW